MKSSNAQLFFLWNSTQIKVLIHVKNPPKGVMTIKLWDFIVWSSSHERRTKIGAWVLAMDLFLVKRGHLIIQELSNGVLECFKSSIGYLRSSCPLSMVFRLLFFKHLEQLSNFCLHCFHACIISYRHAHIKVRSIMKAPKWKVKIDYERLWTITNDYWIREKTM